MLDSVPEGPAILLSIFAFDPSGSYYAIWLNRDCGISFTEAQVL